MNRTIAQLAVATAAWSGLFLSGCTKSHGVPDYGVTVNSIPGLPADFMKGADVSALAQLEENGAKFYDESGKEKDALQILKDHGINWVRLRLWNAPVIANAFTTTESGATLDVQPGWSAAGTNDLARDIALAKRAKGLGMKVLLDFHYSDWWADPGKQFMPQAWTGYSLEQTETALHDFTRDTLAAMKVAGAQPDMVQIGNELNDGFLWPVGKISTNGYDNFAALLSQASAAVREVDPAIQIMIHLANGGDNGLYRSVFTQLANRGVDFDVIGLSYYPFWHGPMGDLRANLNDVSSYFNKPVVVVETAYGWTLDNADTMPNAFGAHEEALGGYKATVQGQATFLHDLMATVADVPDRKGLGVFYWAPEWIAVEGAGVYTGAGNNWDNLTLFNPQGKALPSMNVFRAVSEERPWVEPELVSIPPVTVAVQVGSVPTLPTSVNAVYSDGSVRPLYTVWQSVDPASWNAVGTVEVKGAVAGTDLQATLNAVVYVNLVTNPGFENGSTGWTITGTGASVITKAADAHSGTNLVTFWNAAQASFSVSQTVTGLDPSLTYAFSAWFQGAGGQLEVFATCNGVTKTQAADLTGYLAWKNPTITGLTPGADGTCEVGVRGTDLPGGAWGTIDDALLVPSL
jgi:arabinogalactan endo-1,4-beta-galactosidase